MEIEKMTTDNRAPQNHKEIAMNFLEEANQKMESPIPRSNLEAVYDLFVEGEASTVNYQRSLKKIIKNT